MFKFCVKTTVSCTPVWKKGLVQEVFNLPLWDVALQMDRCSKRMAHKIVLTCRNYTGYYTWWISWTVGCSSLDSQRKKNQYYLLLSNIRTFIFLKEIQRLKHNLRNLPWSSAMMLVVTKGGTAPRVDVWKSPPRFTLSSSITWICDIQKHTMPREKPNRQWRDKK